VNRPERERNLYTYLCPHCGRTVEVFHAITGPGAEVHDGGLPCSADQGQR
jgi:hypothetical protein